jgi:hypothetical protein
MLPQAAELRQSAAEAPDAKTGLQDLMSFAHQILQSYSHIFNQNAQVIRQNISAIDFCIRYTRRIPLFGPAP